MHVGAFKVSTKKQLSKKINPDIAANEKLFGLSVRCLQTFNNLTAKMRSSLCSYGHKKCY